jgi:hypothetical protein
MGTIDANLNIFRVTNIDDLLDRQNESCTRRDMIYDSQACFGVALVEVAIDAGRQLTQVDRDR